MWWFLADQRWRNPDLPEVIEFLSHPSNGIKANAAAYLQHLTYMDDPVKAKTRYASPTKFLVSRDCPSHSSAMHASLVRGSFFLFYFRVEVFDELPLLSQQRRRSKHAQGQELCDFVAFYSSLFIVKVQPSFCHIKIPRHDRLFT